MRKLKLSKWHLTAGDYDIMKNKLNPQFKKELEESLEEYKKGETVSFSDIKKKLKNKQ